MLPAAVAAVVYGSWVFAMLASVLGALGFWEWQGFCADRSDARRRGSWFAGIAGCALGPLLVPLAGVGAGLLIYLAMTAVFVFLAVAERRPHIIFLMAGFVYILAGVMTMVSVRNLPVDALETILWLLLVVTATDTGAYFTGRSLGGPKLAPRISPKKTWSGLAGGMLGAALVGALVMLAFGKASIVPVALVSALVAVVAQAGDLIVSIAKRKFKVKDSSDLIPGHGGVLDRLDGYLTVVPAIAVLSWLAGGSPLSWL